VSAELNDPDRARTRLPDVRTKSLVMELRAWLIQLLAGDSAVALNLTIFGSIQNRGSANGAVIKACEFLEPDSEISFFVRLDPACDQRVTW